MSNSVIMAIKLDKRRSEASDVQKILTENGCLIRVRLGLHETSSSSCSDEGIILLQLSGDAAGMAKLEKDLKAVAGVTVKSMEI